MTKQNLLGLVVCIGAMSCMAEESAAVVGELRENASAEKAPELVSDRPDFTESSEVVGRGYWQWESGISLERRGKSLTAGYGAPLLRVGINRRWELRFGSDGLMRERAGVTAMSDTQVGFKYKMLSEGRFLPAMALVTMLSTPVGHSAYSSQGADPELKWTWAKEMQAGFSASGNFNWASLTMDGARLTQKAVTLSIGHDLAKGFAGYWEVFGFSAEELEGGKSIVFQSGVTRGLGENTQVDFSVARRLTAAGPDWSGSIGLVMRGKPMSWIRGFNPRRNLNWARSFNR